jgi:hypothetical protein
MINIHCTCCVVIIYNDSDWGLLPPGSGTFSKKKTFKSGWIIEGKLATSGRLMTRLQLAWVIKHGIKSVITI